jgi:hypothetical protein
VERTARQRPFPITAGRREDARDRVIVTQKAGGLMRPDSIPSVSDAILQILEEAEVLHVDALRDRVIERIGLPADFANHRIPSGGESIFSNRWRNAIYRLTARGAIERHHDDVRLVRRTT